MKNKTGLLSRIRTAATPVEVDRLLKEGSTFLKASDNTKNKWRRAAQQRKAILNVVKPNTNPSEE